MEKVYHFPPAIRRTTRHTGTSLEWFGAYF
jgi:hypothetical protein